MSTTTGHTGFVEQLDTGAFLAVDFVPVSKGLRTGAALRKFSKFEDVVGRPIALRSSADTSATGAAAIGEQTTADSSDMA